MKKIRLPKDYHKWLPKEFYFSFEDEDGVKLHFGYRNRLVARFTHSPTKEEVLDAIAKFEQETGESSSN